MPTDKLTLFIKELCAEYSELLFFSFRITKELKEIDLVKNALNERFKKLNKICFQLEAELHYYRNSNRPVKNNLEKKIENIEELKFKLSNQENNMNILQLNLEV